MSVAPSSTSQPAAACPYRGLAPYTEKDAKVFFGRDRDCDVLAANALSTRLTIYYGPSGAGKSSVLRAGLVQRLRVQARTNLERFGSPEAIAVYFASWRDEPIPALLSELRKEIAAALPGAEAKLSPAGESLSATLSVWGNELGADLIIVLDQFEEFFLYQHGIREHFAREMAELLAQRGARVNFVISLREDALAQLDAFQSFMPRLFENCLRLEHLSEEGARQAIQAPLAATGDGSATPRVTLGPGLLDAVIAEVKIGQVTLGASGTATAAATAPASGSDGAPARIETPYLQLVMVRLWEECIKDGSGTLSLEKFQTLNGAKGIVHSHLDKTLDSFTDEERTIAAQVFPHLVTPSGSKIAHWLDDLAKFAGKPAAEVGLVLEKLCRPELRVLRNVTPAQQRDRARYEIFHDVLAAAILDWQRRYDQVRGAEKARADAEQEHAEAAAQAAAKAEKDKMRRAVRVRVYLSVALIVALGMVGIAGWKWSEAVHAQKAADKDRETAIAANKEMEAALERARNSSVEAKNLAIKAEVTARQRQTALSEANASAEAAEAARKEAEKRSEDVKRQNELQLLTAQDVAKRINFLASTINELQPTAPLSNSKRTLMLKWLKDIEGAARGDTELVSSEKVTQQPPKDDVRPPEGSDGWVYAGRLEANKRKWNDRSFDAIGEKITDPAKIPAPGDLLKANISVNLRSLPNGFFLGQWESQPIVGLLRHDESVTVQKVEEVVGPDQISRIWVLAKRIQKPVPVPPPVIGSAAPPPARWVEFWSKKDFAPNAKHLRIDDPVPGDPTLKDDNWEGTHNRVYKDIQSVKTGPGTWFEGFDDENFRGQSIKIRPEESVPGPIKLHIESYRTYSTPPEWDQAPRP